MRHKTFLLLTLDNGGMTNHFYNIADNLAVQVLYLYVSPTDVIIWRIPLKYGFYDPK